VEKDPRIHGCGFLTGARGGFKTDFNTFGLDDLSELFLRF
jgi:hypothetical protein